MKSDVYKKTVTIVRNISCSGDKMGRFGVWTIKGKNEFALDTG